MKLSTVCVALVASASAQLQIGNECTSAVTSVATFTANADLSGMCTAVDDVFGKCASMTGFGQCCPKWDAFLQAVSAVVTECPQYLTSGDVANTQMCSVINDACNSACGQALQNASLDDFKWCTYDFFTDGLEQVLDSLTGGVSIPGVNPAAAIKSALQLMEKPGIAEVCTFASYIDPPTCEALLEDPAGFDYSQLVEPFYPNFALPDTVRLTIDIEGLTGTLSNLGALDSAVKADFRNFLNSVGLPTSVFDLTVRTVVDTTAQLVVRLLPPSDFDEVLKQMLPHNISPSFWQFGGVAQDSLPDGNDWPVPSTNFVWSDLVTAVTTADLSTVTFPTLEASAVGSAGMQITPSAPETKPTTYASLGREEPRYGTGLQQPDQISSASQVHVAVGAVALAAAVVVVV